MERGDVGGEEIGGDALPGNCNGGGSTGREGRAVAGMDGERAVAEAEGWASVKGWVSGAA